jgi:phosphoglycolate phosphatase
VLKLVLFDCDGTLVDSQNMIVATMGLAFGKLGLPEPERAAVLSTIGLSLPEAVTSLTGGAPGVSVDTLVAAYRQAYIELSPRLDVTAPLFPGVRTMLEALAARLDVALGIVTGKSRHGLDAILAVHGLEGTFAVLRTGDDGPSKPHPFMVTDAVAAVGADIARTVVIGDTAFDIDMAHAAGARSIAVDWGYHDGATLEASRPDAYAMTASELPGLIDRLIGEGSAA